MNRRRIATGDERWPAQTPCESMENNDLSRSLASAFPTSRISCADRNAFVNQRFSTLKHPGSGVTLWNRTVRGKGRPTYLALLARGSEVEILAMYLWSILWRREVRGKPRSFSGSCFCIRPLGTHVSSFKTTSCLLSGILCYVSAPSERPCCLIIAWANCPKIHGYI